MVPRTPRGRCALRQRLSLIGIGDRVVDSAMPKGRRRFRCGAAGKASETRTALTGARLQRTLGFGGDGSGWNRTPLFLSFPDRAAPRKQYFARRDQQPAGNRVSRHSRRRIQSGLPQLRLLAELEAVKAPGVG